ncbi:MAG: hypothetical protein AB4426_07595 [Xenococcaceae cyanobacterium]
MSCLLKFNDFQFVVLVDTILRTVTTCAFETGGNAIVHSPPKGDRYQPIQKAIATNLFMM